MSGDSRVFPPISVPSLTLASAPGGSFNPNIATSFQANSAQTSGYNLIFPSALPSTTNQALLSDTAGNLTWGTVSSGGGSSSSGTTSSAAYGTFAASAPQSTAAPVTGLQFSNTFTSAQLYVAVSATTNIFAIYDMQAYQKGSTSLWSLTYSLTTDTDDIDPGLVFTITATGQVQYTSPTYAGWTATSIQWYYTYNYTTSTGISQITNSYSGASNVTTATAVTGLLVPTGSKQMTVSIFIVVKATTNLSALISVTVYQNAAGTAFQISTTNTGDNVGIALTVNSSGQVLYTSTTYAGFTSLLMSWTTPFIASTTATSLTSLALTSGLTVNGKTLLAQNAGTGSVVSTVGSLVSIAGSTYTDTSTAASSAAPGNFSGTYLGIPTLAATNTGVTNSSASTLTIAGAPLAGTNTTITSAYALNVLNGISQFAGPILANGPLTAKVVTGTSLFLGNSVVTGILSSTLGQFLTVQPQTYTDTGTAASGTAAGTFSASYLGIPTLTATNTGVTTGTASTLTIAGPPTAGTNETITNPYALNVVSGNANIPNILTNGISWTGSSQFATFTGTNSTTSSGNYTGGSFSFTIPNGYPWILNPGTGTSVTLGKGQYIISFFANNPMSSAATAGGGTYADLGMSKNGNGLSTNRMNLNGYYGGYIINQSLTDIFLSAGTDTLSGADAIGGGVYFNSSQTVTVRIAKIG